MKKWIFMMFICLISSLTFASPAPNVMMSGLTVVRLSKVNSTTMTLEVHYPGSLSHVCTLVMRGDNTALDLSKVFAKRFQFTHLFSSEKMNYDVDVSGELVFKLEPDAFVDGLTITTVDGKSIASNVAEVFPSKINDVGFLEGVCS
jgi:hypothetical protein